MGKELVLVHSRRTPVHNSIVRYDMSIHLHCFLFTPPNVEAVFYSEVKMNVSPYVSPAVKR